MGNIFKVLRRDFLRLFKVPAAWVILFGMVFIPPLYSWYNIVGFWDPYGNTKGITVAIANNDDGTDNALIGKQNLGDQIVKQMRSNDQLGWTFVTEAEAMDQVESGKAYAAIIIPKDFSDDLAGVVTGALTWLLPLSWEWQGTLFAVLTLLAAWLWWKWLARRVQEQKPADSHLNQRGQQLVGRRFILETALVNGRGHMRVGDSSWPVSASDDLSAGTQVEVIAVEGITLIITAVSH